MNNTFLINWLKTACIITTLAGVAPAIASTDAGSGIWLFLFDLLKWPIDNDPAVFHPDTLVVNAVLGGVMIAWGILMYLLVAGPVSRGNVEIIRYILISLVVWFIVDSAGSILAGLPANIILNTVFLILYIPPLFILSGRYKDAT